MDMYSNKHELELKIVVLLAVFLISGIMFCIWNVLKFLWNGEHSTPSGDNGQNGQQSENEDQLEMGYLYRVHNWGNEFHEIESADPPD